MSPLNFFRRRVSFHGSSTHLDEYAGVRRVEIMSEGFLHFHHLRGTSARVVILLPVHASKGILTILVSASSPKVPLIISSHGNDSSHGTDSKVPPRIKTSQPQVGQIVRNLERAVSSMIYLTLDR